MTAPFRLDKQVTIEQRTAAQDPDYGSEIDAWVVVADHIWANTLDMLPSRGAESTASGLVMAFTRTRLRIQTDLRIVAGMRVTLHDEGDRVMKIVAGPATLDDRRHAEFMLEGFSS